MATTQVPKDKPSFSVILGAGAASNATDVQNANPASGGAAAFIVTANVTPGVYSGGSANIGGVSCGNQNNKVQNNIVAFGVTSAQTSFIVYANSSWATKTKPADSATSSAHPDSPITGNSGIFVFGGYTTAGAQYVKTSTDGVVWTTRAIFGSTSQGPMSVANNIFFWGSSGTQIKTSTDGITWVTRVCNLGNITTTYGPFVAYGNSTYVAFGKNGGVNTSTDTITWTTRQLTANPLTNITFPLVYGSAGFAAVNGSTTYATSTDGITWTTRSWTTATGGSPSNGFTYGDNKYVVFTSVAGGTKSAIYSTTNFTTWTYLADTIFLPASLTYINNMFVSSANTAEYGIAVSTDAITWVTKKAGARSDHVTYGNGLYMNYNGSTWDVYTSSNVSGTVTDNAVANLVGSKATAIF